MAFEKRIMPITQKPRNEINCRLDEKLKYVYNHESTLLFWIALGLPIMPKKGIIEAIPTISSKATRKVNNKIQTPFDNSALRKIEKK